MCASIQLTLISEFEQKVNVINLNVSIEVHLLLSAAAE